MPPNDGSFTPPAPESSPSSTAAKLGGAAVEVGASMIPGVGELMDVYTLFAADSSMLDRGMSVVSLGANALTGGLLPNFGGWLKAGRKVANTAEAAGDIAKTADKAKDLTKGATNVAEGTAKNGSTFSKSKVDGDAGGTAGKKKKRDGDGGDGGDGGNGGDGGSSGEPNIVEHPSERAARRAAEREAGMGKHGGRTELPPEVPNTGSRSPQGDPGLRTQTRSNDTGNTVHHDPYGHRFPDGKTIPPHYGVDVPGKPTNHHTYPTTHDPKTNR